MTVEKIAVTILCAIVTVLLWAFGKQDKVDKAVVTAIAVIITGLAWWIL